MSLLAITVLATLFQFISAQQGCASNFIGLAEADFNGDIGVYGYARIYSNGTYHIDIEITPQLDLSICGANPYPLEYHLHEIWSYGSSDMSDKYGAGCSAEYTGGHFNPYGGPVCTAVPNDTFYNCEIGDFSGRFGLVTPNVFGRITETHVLNDGDCLCGRLTPEMAYLRSIVFHCNDGTRLMCAPFGLTFEAPREPDLKNISKKHLLNKYKK